MRFIRTWIQKSCGPLLLEMTHLLFQVHQTPVNTCLSFFGCGRHEKLVDAAIVRIQPRNQVRMPLFHSNMYITSHPIISPQKKNYPVLFYAIPWDIPLDIYKWHMVHYYVFDFFMTF